LKRVFKNTEEKPRNNQRHIASLMFLRIVFFESTLLLVAWVLGWLLGVPLFDVHTWNWKGLAVGLSSTLPLISMFFWLLQSQWEPCQNIRRIMDVVIRPMFQEFTILQLLVISLVAGISEEILFRGVIQGGAQTSMGAPAAIVLSAVLFGACHALTPFYFVLATFMGVYMSVVWMATGQLLAPIITHAVYDFLVLVWYLHYSNQRKVSALRKDG